MFLVNVAFRADTSLPIDVQPRFAVGAIEARGLRVGKLPQHSRIAGALPADAVGDIVDVNMYFFKAASWFGLHFPSWVYLLELRFAPENLKTGPDHPRNLALGGMDSYNEIATSQTFPHFLGK